MATNNGRHSPEYILSQVNSILNGEKSPAEVRAEDRGQSFVAEAPTQVPDGLGSAAKHYHARAGDEFSPAETYKFQADGYYNQGDTAMGDAYSALWSGSNAYSNTAKQINDFYNELGRDISTRENALLGVKSDLANKLIADMAKDKQYVMDTFGPEGSLTQEINKYYDDLGNYLSTDAGRQAARIAAQGTHTGASLGSIRAQQNEAYNQSFARYVQAKEQEINAKQTIASNLINYMSTLRQEYGDTTNTYIIGQYQRANDLLNTINQSIANANIELASTKLAQSLKGSGSNGDSSEYSFWTEFWTSMTPSEREAFNAANDATKRATYNNFLNNLIKSGYDLYVNGGQPETNTNTNETVDDKGDGLGIKSSK